MGLPRGRGNWSDDEIQLLYKNWQSTMMILSEKSPIKSEKYRLCLERGREVIIEKMIELIVDETYVKRQPFYSWYCLYWRDAPSFMAKFLQLLETVFTVDTEIKIRKKLLVPYVTSANGKVTLPAPTKHWSETEINTLYKECESAVSLLEKNPAIISEKYKQCFRKGRNIIIETMMKFIMDTENFPKDPLSSQYILSQGNAPKALATILHHSETVFTGNREFRIEKKAIEFPEKDKLVYLVKEPDPRQKCGILRTYGEIKSFSADNKFHLKVLQGKRIWDEEWVEEGETYILSEEANAMLCMHLWSLRKYAGDESYENIWNDIKNGWPECVSWEKGPAGKFWKMIVPDQLPSWVVDGYKEMEKYFKEDSEHSSETL